MRQFFKILLFLLIGIPGYSANLIIGTQTTLLDGSVDANKVNPGDTIFMLAGQWDNIEIRNFAGSANKPLIFTNKGGVATFSTNHNHGISIQNCRYFKLTGTGVKSEFYGIRIEKVENGTGIGIGNLSSDFEIDHVSIKNVPIAGIYAKTDPDCSGQTTREKFTQYNTNIHDNYIENAGNEGLYIGSTKYSGQTVKCNGKDTLLLPSLLEGVKVYNNIVRNSGWDGIQVSSASKNCSVYQNKIYNDSQAETSGQMSGIIIGGGSRCDCYNNLIVDGKGDGIEIHGTGGNKIFNNLVINAGKTFFPGNFEAVYMKHGMFISDVSAQKDSSFYILNNTIVNPKSDGIRFSSVNSKSNLIASNVIVNPGNFDYYENGNFRVKGVDSYVMLPDQNADVKQLNNFFTRDFTVTGLNQVYEPKAGSPLINAGFPGPPTISFDFDNSPRLPANRPDIGAFEYQIPTFVQSRENAPMVAMIYPNPANTNLAIRIQTESSGYVQIDIYNDQGVRISSSLEKTSEKGIFEIHPNIQFFTSGVYICCIKQGKHLLTEKFIYKK